MARPMKPTGAKILKGTFRKCRANKNEPKPIPIEGIPTPPRRLSRTAKKEWDRVIEYVVNNQIVGAEGLSILVTYCEIHAAIADEKDILKVPASYLAQYQKLAGSFGLTGDARAKMKTPKAAEETKNPFEAFK
jgi:phage terminase small subunit